MFWVAHNLWISKAQKERTIRIARSFFYSGWL